jgi:CRP-like cAMP-binding protein
MSAVQEAWPSEALEVMEMVKPAEGILSTFVLRLAALDGFDAAALGALRSLGLQLARVPADYEIVHEGAMLSEVTVLLGGYAYRGKTLADGSRQMSGLLLAGDVCDFSFLSATRSSLAVTTLAPSLVARFPVERLLAVAREHGCYLRAMLRAAAVERAIANEHMISLSARDAKQRMSHMLCEIAFRLDVVRQMATSDTYTLPLTQAQLGELLGLSAVHVNRTLQALRGAGLMKFGNGVLSILDRTALARLSDFDPAYLNPNGVEV